MLSAYSKHALLLVVALLAVTDGPKDGRQGNKMYREGKYAEAADAYRAGLQGLPETRDPVRFGLLNNLGAALFQQNNFGEAREAFERAAYAAPDPARAARAAYNAGNTAYSMQALEDALAYYAGALMADPNNEDAKFNYEFVKRRLDEQKQQQQNQGRNQDQQQNQGQQEQQQSGQSESDQQNQPQEPQNQNEQQPDRQNQEQQNQAGEEQQEGQQEDPQQAASSQPRPNEMSREQAERILQALQDDEEDLLRQAQKLKGRPGAVDKDW